MTQIDPHIVWYISNSCYLLKLDKTVRSFSSKCAHDESCRSATNLNLELILDLATFHCPLLLQNYYWYELNVQVTISSCLVSLDYSPLFSWIRSGHVSCFRARIWSWRQLELGFIYWEGVSVSHKHQLFPASDWITNLHPPLISNVFLRWRSSVREVSCGYVQCVVSSCTKQYWVPFCSSHASSSSSSSSSPPRYISSSLPTSTTTYPPVYFPPSPPPSVEGALSSWESTRPSSTDELPTYAEEPTEEPETLARSFFFYGFFCPPLIWLIGALMWVCGSPFYFSLAQKNQNKRDKKKLTLLLWLLLCWSFIGPSSYFSLWIPLSPISEEEEPNLQKRKQLQEAVEILRVAEVRWAKRCLKALVLFWSLVALAVVMAISVVFLTK